MTVKNFVIGGPHFCAKTTLKFNDRKIFETQAFLCVLFAEIMRGFVHQKGTSAEVLRALPSP